MTSPRKLGFNPAQGFSLRWRLLFRRRLNDVVLAPFLMLEFKDVSFGYGSRGALLFSRLNWQPA